MTKVPIQTEEPEGWGLSKTGFEQVVRWRKRELEAAGYEAADAFVLANRTDIDLHLATDLLHRGCPHETALRILL